MKFKWFLYSVSILAVTFVALPIFNMLTKPSLIELFTAIKDKEVLHSLSLSLYAALTASAISIIIGTPLAYVFARKDFPFKRTIEGIIDIPIMIPHPVIGLAILSVVAKDCYIGKILNKFAIDILGSVTGIIVVLVYVGFPFYVNSVKAGFKSVPERLEYVSRSLGKSQLQTFLQITLPLTYKSIIEGLIMSTARAISEFGAVIVIAYHPMVAPVLIYERFTSYGLKYSAPVAVLLILICLILFILLRFFSSNKNN
jgi:molybdate/tungstate transport system permease protein